MNANKTSETRYDWTKAPEWARYAATDQSGISWWFENPTEPCDTEGDGYWRIPLVGEWETQGKRADRCLDWDDSLELRPLEPRPESPAREGVEVSDAEVEVACIAASRSDPSGLVWDSDDYSEDEREQARSCIRAALLAFLNARSERNG